MAIETENLLPVVTNAAVISLHQVQTCMYREPRTSGQAAVRYCLKVVNRAGQDAVMRVLDRLRDCLFIDWQGAVVRHLLESGILPEKLRRSGCYACDKSFVRHLLLAGAATRMVLDKLGPPDTGQKPTRDRPLPFHVRPSGVYGGNRRASLGTLSDRLRGLGLRLTGPHKRIAQILFACPGYHFSTADVRCLLLLECAPLADHQAATWLGDLVHWKVIQCIAVDSENIFYDIDTSPHLHLFDPGTRELRDADTKGVVRIDTSMQ